MYLYISIEAIIRGWYMKTTKNKLLTCIIAILSSLEPITSYSAYAFSDWERIESKSVASLFLLNTLIFLHFKGFGDGNKAYHQCLSNSSFHLSISFTKGFPIPFAIIYYNIYIMQILGNF